VNPLLSFPTSAEAASYRRCAPLAPSGFPPTGFGWDVVVDAAALPNAASGKVVNSWQNTGALGGYLTPPADVPLGGPRYRPNSGAPYLEFGISGGKGYWLGCNTGMGVLGDFTLVLIVQRDQSASITQRTCWATRGVNAGDDGKEQLLTHDLTFRFGMSFDDYGASTSRISPLTDSLFHVVSVRRANRVYTIRVDGQQVDQHSATLANPLAGRFILGGMNFGEIFKGGIGRAYYANQAADPQYIADLEASLMATHPLLLTGRNKGMVVCGDSTSTDQYATVATDGTGTWLPLRGNVWQYGNYLQTNNGLGKFWNNSYGGKTTAQHRAPNELARIAGWLNSVTIPWLVIDSGTNDIRAGGAGLTPAQSFAQIQGLISDVTALVKGSLNVAVWTIGDGDPAFYVGFTALRNTLNTAIAGGSGYTAIRRDLAAVGADGAYAAQPTWFAANDGLHRCALGMDQEATVGESALGGVM